MKLSALAMSLAAALALLFFRAAPASAATIGVTYSGVVTGVGGTVGAGPFAVGDTVTFHVTLDNTVPPIESYPDAALYDAVTQFTGTFSNGYAFTANTGGSPGANGVWVRPWAVSHSVTIAANYLSAPPVNGLDLVTTFIHFEDLTATMLQSTAIPGDLASLLSLSQDHYFQLLFMGGGDEFSIGGTITSAVAVAPTPIPAALPLLVSALGALGFAGWKRRRTASIH